MSRYGVVAKVLVLKTTEDSSKMQDVVETQLLVRVPVITGLLFVNQARCRCARGTRWTVITTATTSSRRRRTCRVWRAT